MEAYETGRISRRHLLLSLPALMMAPRAFAQADNPPIRVRGINHVTLGVSDVKRSVDFYQGLFGMPVTSRQGMTTNLRIGAGPQFLGVGAADSNPLSINHLCLSVESFNPDAVIKALESYGIKPRASAQSAPGPLVHYISMRMENRGGAKEGTPELYFTDPDGLLIQLQDVKYCGGGGILGDVCS
jgi:catechol 2,3-dioxygenase-like lactoylglutathione lyase family enzyme